MKNKKHWIILITSILLLTFSHFTNYFHKDLEAVILFLVIPFLIIKFVLKEKIKNYGFRFGNKKLALIFTSIGILITIFVTYFATKYFVDIKNYYYINFDLMFVVTTIIYMTCWEFMFRGYLLVGLKKLGFWNANIIQTVLFFLMHIGKPGIELYSTLLTGLVFGYITYKSKSLIPMIIIHSAIMIFVVFFATLQLY